MTRILIASLAALPFVAGAAFAAPQVGMLVGTDAADISKNLGAFGYDVVEIGHDSDIIEAEVRDLDGIYDLEIDPASGIVTSVEIDLDEDGDV